jgi:hypothetical protein
VTGERGLHLSDIRSIIARGPAPAQIIPQSRAAASLTGIVKTTKNQLLESRSPTSTIANSAALHASQVSRATDFDADRSLCPFLRRSSAWKAQLFLSQFPVPQVAIFNINRATIQAVTNLRPTQANLFSRAIGRLSPSCF